MGDINTKIVARQQGEELILGTANNGTRNDRGNLLIKFALQHKLKVISSYLRYLWKGNEHGNLHLDTKIQ